MSFIRDARYNAHAAVLCRQDGHRMEGDRCAVCRIRRDDQDVRPYMRDVRMGGVPVSRAIPALGVIAREKKDPMADYRDERGRLNGTPLVKAPALPDDIPCRNGHIGDTVLTPRGWRRCRVCQAAAAQRYREKVAA